MSYEIYFLLPTKVFAEARLGNVTSAMCASSRKQLTTIQPFYGLKRTDYSGVLATGLRVSQASGKVWHQPQHYL